jgi:hypothetical protein
MFCYRSSVRGLIELVLVKTDRESLDWPICRCLHERNDCRRIDSSREKRSERNVRLHSQSYRIREKRLKLGNRVFVSARELRRLTIPCRRFSRPEWD